MDTLLIFFALPIATIIIAAILQKVLNSPISVAALVFAIYLIVTFAAFDIEFLIATIVYTVLAYITALLVKFIKRCICMENNNNICDVLEDTSNTTNMCNCRCRRR